MAGDAFVLVFAADHEAGDILQEDQRDGALAAQFDEMRALDRGLAEQHAVAGDDPDRAAFDMGEARHQRLAEARLEFVQPRAVDDARDHLADVVGGTQVGGDHAENLLGVIGRGFGALPLNGRGFGAVEVAHRPAGEGQGMGVIFRQIVGNAGKAGVDIATAQIFGADDLAGGGPDQRRAGEEDRALVAHDDRDVRHGRHVSSPGGAGTHDHRDLRDALRRHLCLIEEDAAEMVAVGEDLVLVGQVGAAAVHQIDAGQVVLLRNLLGTQMFLHRHRIVGAALHGGVIGHHHHLLPHHPADADDQPRPGGVATIHAVRDGGADFKEGRACIQKVRHPLARRHLAARRMAGDRLVATPGGGAGGGGAGGLQKREMGGAVGAEGLGRGEGGGGQAHFETLLTVSNFDTTFFASVIVEDSAT